MALLGLGAVGGVIPAPAAAAAKASPVAFAAVPDIVAGAIKAEHISVGSITASKIEVRS